MKIAVLSLSSFLVFGLAFLASSCRGPEVPQPETPPSRGQRDRVMSELHGSRKLLTDALAALSDDKLSAPGADGAPSGAEKVAALVEWERGLLSKMQASEVNLPAPEPEPQGLSREERLKRNEEQAAALRARIDACLANYPESAWKPSSGSSAGLAALEQAFKDARDATIAYARETNHNFSRRQVEFPKCGQMDLTTAMMLHAELTSKLAESLP